jgi:hypothetical protein
MLVGCVSFDCHLGSPFYHIGAACCYLICVFTFRHHSLSPQKATPVLTTTLALSLLRRSHVRSVCSDVLASLSRSPPPDARALRSALNFYPQKASAAAGQPAARARRWKGQSRRRPRRPPHCHCGRDAASDPPPRPRSPRRKSSSRWKLIGPFYSNYLVVFLCDELC